MSQESPEEEETYSGLPIWMLYLASQNRPPTGPVYRGFENVTDTSGIFFETSVATGQDESIQDYYQSGAAAGDYDGDGDIDLFFVRGDVGPPILYRNEGGLQFSEVTEEVGLNLPVVWYGSPAFVDLDGDQDLDLIILGNERVSAKIFLNQEGYFEALQTDSGLGAMQSTWASSPAMADYDGDGDLDLAMAHWGTERRTEVAAEETETLWRNDSVGAQIEFHPVSNLAGISPSIVTLEDPLVSATGLDYTLTPSFSDIDGDGDPDLLIAADFNHTQVFENLGTGQFANVTDVDVMIDGNGMGSAVGDFDGDGDMDWFVTSIAADAQTEPPSTISTLGNRLYENQAGRFVDVTSFAGVADGGWGWGACFLDMDNDGDLDLYHTNGWHSDRYGDFVNDRSKAFVNLGNGQFSERAASIGLHDTHWGRGVICADLDNDGDVDIAQLRYPKSGNIAENSIELWKNRAANNYLSVRLLGQPPNTQAVGAKLKMSAGGRDQFREVRLGNNFTVQNPLRQHFGLGETDTVDRLEVTWPTGVVTTVTDVQANQLLEVEEPPLAGVRVSVINAQGGGYYQPGDVIALQAPEPSEHYSFSHWSDNGGGGLADQFSALTSFTVPDQDVTVTAHFIAGPPLQQDVSVARRWNEALLEAIRNDFARPVVHARNLFHISAAAYDIWSAMSASGSSWLLGKNRAGYQCDVAIPASGSSKTEIEVALSEAVAELIRRRFAQAPGRARINRNVDSLIEALAVYGEYSLSDPALASAREFGLGVAECYSEFGLIDGSNETNDYINQYYAPVNPPLDPTEPGNPELLDFNRFQPLSLPEFIDQSGNILPSSPEFLGAEWGSVYPFALDPGNALIYERDGAEYSVYMDDGPPPQLGTGTDDFFHWGFSMVALWSSHLDASDGNMVDISPASVGNLGPYPSDWEGVKNFYKELEGGDKSPGHTVNPVTGAAYAPQMVPRGDYSRVLAEFWADGPDSETPPGHWFVILNSVTDHPLFEPQMEGAGPLLDTLEWDTKAYLALGGAMHDAAITAWSLKGWYDFIRPISALRAMAGAGQSSELDAPDYHPYGLRLVEGRIERVGPDDPLAGASAEHVGKIKLLAWRGPDFVGDPSADSAGVGWILAERWWPYQRPTFVTPPFAGFVSGHSTFSSAAATVLEALTGDPFFPGGKSEFDIPRDSFLVFEKGPTQDMILEWATYRDAADQCSLSRIWGGIHPPLDDIPGRIAGAAVGGVGFQYAKQLFETSGP